MPRSGSFRPGRALLGLVLAFGAGPSAAVEPARPADELLRLVPPDASVVLTVEGLREQARGLTMSRLAADLRRLPVVQVWLESEKYRRFEHSCRAIESVLGVKLADLRDELLGDAVVLVLRLGREAPADPSQARGLLLLRARDRALLERLIEAVNTTQRQNGELTDIGDRRRSGTSYHVRDFPIAAGRLSEWYVTFDDGTFAFSNSESLIEAVIDRKGRSSGGPGGTRGGASIKALEEAGATIDPGLGDRPKFQTLRRRLPEGALARLFLDPRAIERLMAAAATHRPRSEADARIIALFERYLAAADYAGAALAWDDAAIKVHWVETLEPSRLDPWIRQWAGDSRPGDPRLRRVPPTTLALASAHLDPLAFRAAVLSIIPESQPNRIINLEVVLTGLLLGQDWRTRILPCLGPGIVAYADSPEESPELPPGSGTPGARAGLFPLVVAIRFSSQSGETPSASVPRRPAAGAGTSPRAIWIADALENALQTVLALTALDENRGPGRARLVTREVAGATVASLDLPLPFAFAVDRRDRRLILGTSAEAVARYLESSTDPEAGRRFRELQAAAFAGFETFLCIDLDALSRVAAHSRTRLVQTLVARQQRPAATVETDLDHVLALARLFRAAFIAHQIEPDASAIHRILGVILHPQDSPRPATSKENRLELRGER